MSLGNQLQQARQKNGLTQEKVATQLNVSRQTISSWENERSYPDIQNLIDLSDFYHLSLDQMIKEDQEVVDKMKQKEVDARNYRYILIVSEIIDIVLLLLYAANQSDSPHLRLFQMGPGAGWALIALLLLNVTTIFIVQRRYSELSKTGFKVFNPKNEKIATAIALIGAAMLIAAGWHNQNFILIGFAVGILAGLFIFKLARIQQK